MLWSFYLVAWSSLGTVSPDYDWQQFNTPIVGDAVIRISQIYDEPSLGRLINRLFFGEVYADLGRRYLFRIYRRTEPGIHTLSIPQELVDKGFGVRYLEVKHNAFGVINPDTWNVQVELWS